MLVILFALLCFQYQILGISALPFATPSPVPTDLPVQFDANDPASGISPLTGPPLGDTTLFGDATFYNPSVGTGSCGKPYTDSEPVIALPIHIFDYNYFGTDPNSNPICGRRIRLYRVLRPGEGPGSEMYRKQVAAGLANSNTTVEGIVADKCPGCMGNHLDLSPALFNQIAGSEMGNVAIKWSWV